MPDVVAAGEAEGEEVKNRIVMFHLLGFVTTALSLAAMTLSFYDHWRYVAGVAVLACIFYQIRIWLIVPLVK